MDGRVTNVIKVLNNVSNILLFYFLHPCLQPSLHTPVTGEQVWCLQLLHVSLQLRPYFPREHAKIIEIIDYLEKIRIF
jgi:putative effector of murein hydrolase LrgA (UPF0299 family)